jgi:hypothetical protein
MDGSIRTCCRKHWEEDAGRQAKALNLGDGHFALMNPIGMPFMVCKTCGNKRCPKATDCSLACTNSNEPGQEGSIYG